MRLDISNKYSPYHSNIQNMSSLLESDKDINNSDLEKLQTKLDNLANKYQNDGELGSDRYGLFHVQSLIHYRSGNEELAAEFMIQAITIKGENYEFADNFLNSIGSGVGQNSENKNRINRSTYIISVLVSTIALYALIGGLSASVGGDTSQDTGVAGLIIGLIVIVIIIYQIVIGVRRLHDTNHSGWWMLLALVPIANLLVAIRTVFIKGDSTANKYGSPSSKTHVAWF